MLINMMICLDQYFGYVYQNVSPQRPLYDFPWFLGRRKVVHYDFLIERVKDKVTK